MATTRPHRKISRKQLKKPDEFQNFFENARAFVIDNLNQVILSVVIVLVAAAVGVGTYAYERHQDVLASDQFYAAMTALNQNNYKLAEKRFSQLAEHQPGREVGRLSRLYLGTVYLKQNQLKKARNAFVASSAESSGPIFKNMALTNLALTYERLGEFAKAENTYTQAARIAGPEQIAAELGAARMLLKQGKRQAAIEAYRRFLHTHPFSSHRTSVMETLALLGATPSAPMATSIPKKAGPQQQHASAAALNSSKPAAAGAATPAATLAPSSAPSHKAASATAAPSATIQTDR